MKTAIQFSGGKDSTALMYLLRDRLKEDDVTVYFGDTGIVYPHVVSFVHGLCMKLGAKLKIIHPEIGIADFHSMAGLPSDIVPVEASFPMHNFLKEKRPVKLQSSISCCGKMLWEPLYKAMINDGIEIVYRGSKAADSHVGVPDGHIENGIQFLSPIWEWTDEDVFNYLKEVGAELPRHYSKVNNSFDCIFCTAFLNHDGAKKRLEWTRENYPDLWPILEKRMSLVKDVIDTERSLLTDAFDVLGGNDAGAV